MKRPALTRLFEDIKAGKVDMIVVYKIDRLTRSLSDFSKMIDVFDKHKCSFVSVTQNFNTSDSMGRLTLNMLLSFAQFEREIGAERVRDKTAASKKKGMWTGGAVPFGYQNINKKLEINPDEAEAVKFITGRDKISNSRSNSDNIKFSCYDLHNRNTHKKNKTVPTFYNFFIWSYVRSANGKNMSAHTHKEQPNFK